MVALRGHHGGLVMRVDCAPVFEPGRACGRCSGHGHLHHLALGQGRGSTYVNSSGQEGGGIDRAAAAAATPAVCQGGMLYKPSRRLSEACAPLSPIEFHNLWLWTRQDPAIHTLVVGAARPTDFDEHAKGELSAGKQSNLSSADRVMVLTVACCCCSRGSAAQRLMDTSSSPSAKELVRWESPACQSEFCG